MMKLHGFLFRKSTIKNEPFTFMVKGKQHLSAIQECSREESTGTNQSIASMVREKNVWFLFRIIRRSKNQKHNLNKKSHNEEQRPSPTSSHVSSAPTTTTSSTKKANNLATREIDIDAPVSFIRIDTTNMDESSQRELLTKLTSTKLMTEHGLERNDSIISYLKDADNAYHQMIVVFDNGNNHKPVHNQNDDDNNYNNEDYNMSDTEFYSNAVDQSISLITMDPAIAYRHSIVIDEYNSCQSFKSISDRDYEEKDDETTTPLRYYQI